VDDKFFKEQLGEMKDESHIDKKKKFSFKQYYQAMKT
jgi:hypothetical protein